MVPHVKSATSVRTAGTRAPSACARVLSPNRDVPGGGSRTKSGPRTNEPTLSERTERLGWVRFSGKRQKSAGKGQKIREKRRKIRRQPQRSRRRAAKRHTILGAIAAFVAPISPAVLGFGRGHRGSFG